LPSSNITRKTKPPLYSILVTSFMFHMVHLIPKEQSSLLPYQLLPIPNPL
jgi:hypothetical protein